MLEVRQAPSLKNVSAEWVPGGKPGASGSQEGGPSVAAFFGGAASVSAALAGLSTTHLSVSLHMALWFYSWVGFLQGNSGRSVFKQSLLYRPWQRSPER